MPLRLLVLNTISSDGDKSPAAFGQALAYFERPGRAELILSARQRCLETPIPEPGSVPPEDIEELVIEAAPEQPSRPTRRRAWPVVTAVCVSAVVVVLATGHQSGGGSSSARPGALAGIVAHVAETGREFARGIAKALPFGSSGGEEIAQMTTPADPPAAPARRVKRRIAVEEVQPVAKDASVAGPADVAPGLVADASSLDEQESPLDVGDSEEETRSLVEGTNDVTPPRLLDPVRLPSWAQTDGNMLSRIELDINDSGTVERVRMVSPAMRLTDMMILSAAKMWIFEPASKDGRPVPYRLTLNWVSPNR
jgi:hypothetical protein